MSCGDPDDVDCQEVVRQVQEYLHHELDEVHLALIQRHIVACGPCLQEYDLEEALRSLIARSCACLPAPPELRDAVLTRITATITVTER
jgi:anti-sigma factor (TIGR02949 family)